uniref:Uncharacterized protein n=1 Tax=candidate division CPR3 bacterium TaxID=2268181 RepID=A0A7C4R6L3_UNCC3
MNNIIGKDPNLLTIKNQPRSPLSLFRILISGPLSEKESESIYQAILNSLEEIDDISKLETLLKFVEDMAKTDISKKIIRKNNPQFEIISSVSARIYARILRLQREEINDIVGFKKRKKENNY